MRPVQNGGGWLNKDQVVERATKCVAEKLCYISLRPLENDWGWNQLGNGALIPVKNKYWEGTTPEASEVSKQE